MKMKKVFLLLLLVFVGVLTFSVKNVSAAVESPYIDMMKEVNIPDNDTKVLVKGYNSYTKDTESSVILMLEDHNFIKINIDSKDHDGITLNYILEVNHSGYWQEVKTVSSSAGTGGVVDIYTPIYEGYKYRLYIENPSNWLERDTGIDVKWRAIS